MGFIEGSEWEIGVGDGVVGERSCARVRGVVREWWVEVLDVPVAEIDFCSRYLTLGCDSDLRCRSKS